MHHDFLRIAEYFSRNADSGLPPPPTPYQWSDNLWISERGPWIALFRPLNLGVLYLRRQYLKIPLEHQASNVPDDLIDKLVTERFFVPQHGNTDAQEHDELIATAQKGKFRFICVLPTTGCGLKCAYCHQRPERGKERTMTREEIVRGIEKCARLCTDTSKPVDILLYGGEPLEAFDITEDILKLAKPDNGLFQQNVRISFTTTGCGLTAREADILAGNNVFVIVSIDGPPDCNDAVRPSNDGSSSFAIAEEAYHMLKARGGRVGLSVTIGKHNIAGLTHNLEYLLDRFQPDDIGLNAFLHRRGDKPNPYQVASEETFSAFMDGFNLTRKIGLYAEQPFRRLKPFALRRPLLKDCSSPGERLVLAPGGLMGFCDSCYPDHRYFYQLDDFPDEDHPDYRLWSGLSSPEMPHCRVCPAMTVCGGACRYDAYKASGQLDGVDPERCKFELLFLNWMIWELFDKVNIGDSFYYLPENGERKILFGNVSLSPVNQPFTAGSYSK